MRPWPQVAFSSLMKMLLAMEDTTINEGKVVVATFSTASQRNGVVTGSASGKSKLLEPSPGGANLSLLPKEMAPLGGLKKEKCASWKRKTCPTS